MGNIFAAMMALLLLLLPSLSGKDLVYAVKVTGKSKAAERPDFLEGKRKIKHHILADLLGMARETITREIGRIQREKSNEKYR